MVLLNHVPKLFCLMLLFDKITFILEIFLSYKLWGRCIYRTFTVLASIYIYFCLHVLILERKENRTTGKNPSVHSMRVIVKLL